MITQSDNDAASALWAHVGRGRLRYFLGRAGMKQTQLGPGGYWGLTQITAHDERLLLDLIMYPNPVLDSASRTFALNLMAQVIPAQRWGVPAGAPADLTVHVKNGWLPLATHGWRIHSIGCFTGHHRGYLIVALTEDNPTMAYGITTIQRVAEVIHRQLNPAAAAFLPPSAPAPSWGTPDEQIPPVPGRPVAASPDGRCDLDPGPSWRRPRTGASPVRGHGRPPRREIFAEEAEPPRRRGTSKQNASSHLGRMVNGRPHGPVSSAQLPGRAGDVVPGLGGSPSADGQAITPACPGRTRSRPASPAGAGRCGAVRPGPGRSGPRT